MFKVFLAAMLLGLSVQSMSAPTVGGTFLSNLGSEPPTLNPLSSQDAGAAEVESYIMSSLLERNPDTYEWEESLAKEWSISKDGMIFEFKLREDAKFHDGHVVRAEDVKFTFDAIMDKSNKYKTAHRRSYFENFDSVEIVDPLTVRFKAKEVYFANFDQAAGLSIVPKHIYQNPDDKKEKKLNKTIIGSGPYILDEFKRGRQIVLKRNKDWYGFKLKNGKDKYNFDRILMRFLKEPEVELQRFEKGDLDFVGLSPEKFVLRAKGDRCGKKLIKKKVENKSPSGYSFIAFNMKSPVFSSVKTRKALAMLVNKPLMNEKFQFDLSLDANGPVYRQSFYNNTSVKPVPYDPKAALKLLREDGWADKNQDGILEKDGIKLSFTILEPLQDFIKYLTIFQEDAKKSGVDINVKYVEWNTFIKLLNERKFDAVRLAWTGGQVDWDPKQVWHSSSIANEGSNFNQYSNPKVDKLIDEARATMDRNKRATMLKEVHKLIAEDHPYIFFFNKKFSLYAHNKRVQMEKDTYNYTLGVNNWWLSP